MAANAVPDFEQIMYNVSSIFPSIYAALGALVMLMAVFMAFSGVVDLAQTGEKNKSSSAPIRPAWSVESSSWSLPA